MRGGDPALGGRYAGGLRPSAEHVAHVLCATGSGTPALSFRPELPGNAGLTDTLTLSGGATIRCRRPIHGALRSLTSEATSALAAGHRVPPKSAAEGKRRCRSRARIDAGVWPRREGLRIS